MQQKRVVGIEAVYTMIDRMTWRLKWEIHQSPFLSEPYWDNLWRSLVFCIEHDDWSKLFYPERDVTIPRSEYEYLLPKE